MGAVIVVDPKLQQKSAVIVKASHRTSSEVGRAARRPAISVGLEHSTVY